MLFPLILGQLQHLLLETRPALPVHAISGSLLVPTDGVSTMGTGAMDKITVEMKVTR